MFVVDPCLDVLFVVLVYHECGGHTAVHGDGPPFASIVSRVVLLLRSWLGSWLCAEHVKQRNRINPI